MTGAFFFVIPIIYSPILTLFMWISISGFRVQSSEFRVSSCTFRVHSVVVKYKDGQ
jgi:hypothetical protein